MPPKPAAPPAQQDRGRSSAFQPLVACLCLVLLLAPLTLVFTGAPSAQRPQELWQQPLQSLRERLWQGSHAGISSAAQEDAGQASRAVLHPGGEYAVAVREEPPGSVPIQEYSSSRSAAPLQKAYQVMSAPLSDFSGRAAAALAVLPNQVKQLAFPASRDVSARMTFQQWQHKMLDYFLLCSRQISVALSWGWHKGAAGSVHAHKTARSLTHAVCSAPHRAHMSGVRRASLCGLPHASTRVAATGG